MSGGNRYDDELTIALRQLGVRVEEHPITGTWPTPEPSQRRQVAEVLADERTWLIDNIVGSAVPEALVAATEAGHAVGMLVHYFPSDDPALGSADRERLAATEADAVRAASAVVATSNWTASELAARYGRTDAVVALPGVVPAELAAGSLHHGQPPALMWLARLTNTKDPLTFIEALVQLRDLDWTAQVVGPDAADVGLTHTLRDRVAQAGLEGRILITGARVGVELQAAWERADLLIHTARTEAYGMVVGEALAQGIPTVVPLGTGAIEAQCGVGGSFPPGDATALAGVIRTWLTDEHLRADWRLAAIDARRTLPSWRETAEVVAAALAL
ncbi:MAG: glycosyltransferase family 4 protein [Leucobacter sp.]